jgi:hypothetical protein
VSSPRNPAENLSGSGRDLDNKSPKAFSGGLRDGSFDGCAWLVFPVAFRGASRGLAAVARPNRDGVWSEAGIMESFPPGGLKISWRAPVGRGWSSPIVAQGRVYVTDVELAGHTARERVVCFDK